MKIVDENIPVRYQETDQMGVVYHANYLVWFEIGRTKFMEEIGFPYFKMEEGGIVAPVIDVNIQFIKPVRYGQTAKVKTWVKEYSGLRIMYEYEILDGNGDVAVKGTSKHVCVKKDTFKPISIRKWFPHLHKAYVNAVGDEK